MDHLNPHHYHLWRTAGRILHLIHPKGQHYHVASSPMDAERLKHSMSHEASAPTQSQLDAQIVLHGSEEHLAALREIEAHLYTQRAQLRNQEMTGDLLDQLETAILEIDALANEIKRLENMNTQIDEQTFGKYGYSNTLRTYNSEAGDPRANGVASGQAALTHTTTADDFQARRYQVDKMRFFRKPILRQYHHKGLIWRAQTTQEVASYELFLDLIYVGIIAILGDSAAEDATGHALLRFVITFLMSWKVWQDITQQVNWFEANDFARRLYVNLILACLVGFAVNIEGFYDPPNYTVLVAFFLAARFASALYYVWNAIWIRIVRKELFFTAGAIVVPAVLWIGSIHVSEYSTQGLIWTALLLDILPLSTLFALRSLFNFHKEGKRFKPSSDFFPALAIEHRIERTAGFVTLVLGYSVVATLYKSRSDIGVNAFFGKAVMGLTLAFCYNTLYFEMDTFNLHTHAIRRHAISTFVWTTAHIPLILGYTLAGAALARMVLATDSDNTPIDALEPDSAVKSIPELTAGLRWYYCGGLSIALFSINAIALTHVYRIPRARHFLSKPIILSYRSACALIFVLLPLAEDRLNSLQLVAITAGLIVSCVLLNILGNCGKEPGEPWWRCLVDEFFDRDCGDGVMGRCHYVAKKGDAISEDGSDQRGAATGNVMTEKQAEFASAGIDAPVESTTQRPKE